MNHMLASADPRSKIQESNTDLFIYAMQCMFNGDSGSLRRAGLSGMDISRLSQLSLAQLITMSKQGTELHAHLKQVQGESRRKDLANELLQQGAPRGLMMSLFRMSTRRYSAERARLAVASLRGRPMTSQMDASTEQTIWRLWVVLGDDRNPGELRRADDWLLVAREVPMQLRSAWSLIQQWARDEQALHIVRGDRIRLTESRLTEMESALRCKHGLPSAIA